MIHDSITNIDLYHKLSSDIYEGLSFLKELTPSIANGVHQVTPKVRAIISEYETKRQNEYGFEAHKQYIDIQYTLCGLERISYMPIGLLKEERPYQLESDAVFFSSKYQPQDVMIGNNYFAIFFPQDGHMPQLCVKEPMLVKKAVVKVEI